MGGGRYNDVQQANNSGLGLLASRLGGREGISRECSDNNRKAPGPPGEVKTH